MASRCSASGVEQKVLPGLRGPPEPARPAPRRIMACAKSATSSSTARTRAITRSTRAPISTASPAGASVPEDQPARGTVAWISGGVRRSYSPLSSTSTRSGWMRADPPGPPARRSPRALQRTRERHTRRSSRPASAGSCLASRRPLSVKRDAPSRAGVPTVQAPVSLAVPDGDAATRIGHDHRLAADLAAGAHAQWERVRSCPAPRQ